MGKTASSAQPIKRTPKPAAQSTFACSDTKTFPLNRSTMPIVMTASHVPMSPREHIGQR
ncbi:hypothetical protein [Collinsella aerofaciens]|uniref:hypothetical protein n=1 Tax=Collinsella aerofaciens TaxID=74426 RepID=UPI0034A1ECA6